MISERPSLILTVSFDSFIKLWIEPKKAFVVNNQGKALYWDLSVQLVKFLSQT
jgi:hypothetical protein